MNKIRRTFLLSTLSFCLAFCLLGTNPYAAEGVLDLGTLSIDVSKGETVIVLKDADEDSAYDSSWWAFIDPERYGLNDAPQIATNELGDEFDLDNNGAMDVSAEYNDSKVTFKKLKTCSCENKEFVLSSSAQKKFKNIGKPYFRSWKFIIVEEKPEEKPEDKKPEEKPEDKKPEDKKPQQEQVVTPDEKPATVEANAHTVGEQITIDGAIYQITDLTAGNESIMYVKPEDTGIKSAIIPDTVNIDGEDYKVTDIEDNAFKGCKKLKKVTIGENVLRIGTKAFYKCKKLKKITIKTSALTKDSVDKGAFKGINENAKVKVPKKKVKAYRKIFKKKGLNGKNQKVTK